MIIIGLCGKMGVGKDYIAGLLRNKLKDAVTMGFADTCKYELRNTLSFDKMYGEKDYTTRKTLQEHTSKMKETNINYYVENLDFFINLFSVRGFRYFIIPDVRYEYEMEYIKLNKGFCFYIKAYERNFDRLKKECNNDMDKVREINNHDSEKLSLVGDYDLIINNDYKDDLDINAILDKIIVLT